MMKKSIFALGIAGLIILSSFSYVKKVLVNKTEQPVYEIAVRIVKENKTIDFEKNRKDFIEKLTKLKGVSNDREFKSFYALPTPDKNEVFIGMTQYESNKTVGEVQSNKELMLIFLKLYNILLNKTYKK